MKQLAIIIPAYKETFLRKALESIASQTCKDFTLYIGDDCSPNDLKSIVSDFTVHHRAPPLSKTGNNISISTLQILLKVVTFAQASK